MPVITESAAPRFDAGGTHVVGLASPDPLFDPPDPARVYGALVTFEPGARSAWPECSDIERRRKSLLPDRMVRNRSPDSEETAEWK